MKYWSNNSDVEYLELYKLENIHFMLRYSPNHDYYSLDTIETEELEEYGFRANEVDNCCYFGSDKIKKFHDDVGIS
ncbi:MAG: hypothetical protein GY870_20565 [archaeon]|nr:hypothetical protein [archaeon]